MSPKTLLALPDELLSHIFSYVFGTGPLDRPSIQPFYSNPLALLFKTPPDNTPLVDAPALTPPISGRRAHTVFTPRFQIRNRNFVPEFPYQTATGNVEADSIRDSGT
jgi:hypothetical protein